jgi:uncharacterized OB-fold protein
MIKIRCQARDLHAEIDRAYAAAYADEPNPDVREERTCPECGRENLSSLSFCWDCSAADYQGEEVTIDDRGHR